MKTRLPMFTELVGLMALLGFAMGSISGLILSISGTSKYPGLDWDAWWIVGRS